jgi:hypothetical protein
MAHFIFTQSQIDYIINYKLVVGLSLKEDRICDPLDPIQFVCCLRQVVTKSSALCILVQGW